MKRSGKVLNLIDEFPGRSLNTYVKWKKNLMIFSRILFLNLRWIQMRVKIILILNYSYISIISEIVLRIYFTFYEWFITGILGLIWNQLYFNLSFILLILFFGKNQIRIKSEKKEFNKIEKKFTFRAKNNFSFSQISEI